MRVQLNLQQTLFIKSVPSALSAHQTNETVDPPANQLPSRRSMFLPSLSLQGQDNNIQLGGGRTKKTDRGDKESPPKLNLKSSQSPRFESEELHNSSPPTSSMRLNLNQTMSTPLLANSPVPKGRVGKAAGRPNPFEVYLEYRKKEAEYFVDSVSPSAPYRYLPQVLPERKSIETGFKPFTFEEIVIKLDEKKYRDWQLEVATKADQRKSRSVTAKAKEERKFHSLGAIAVTNLRTKDETKAEKKDPRTDDVLSSSGGHSTKSRQSQQPFTTQSDLALPAVRRSLTISNSESEISPHNSNILSPVAADTLKSEASMASLPLSNIDAAPRPAAPVEILVLPQFTELEMSFDRRKFTINPLWLHIRKRQQSLMSAGGPPETNRERN
eukprot:TRINITY_DN3327_c0_g1_i2.p1 TRINITY_DN3327_c0_g1~~TRINITY_DN3327_c0_g1_i2.p1  ORF type:complete len:431 (+),score=107.42 TRINITY_DN3327_c0_g1_i2:142-1293(+)